MSEPVLNCALASCGRRFVPNVAQLGQARRGRKLYCSPECMEQAHRERMRDFWRSERGRRYGRERYRRAQREAEHGRA